MIDLGRTRLSKEGYTLNKYGEWDEENPLTNILYYVVYGDQSLDIYTQDTGESGYEYTFAARKYLNYPITMGSYYIEDFGYPPIAKLYSGDSYVQIERRTGGITTIDTTYRESFRQLTSNDTIIVGSNIYSDMSNIELVDGIDENWATVLDADYYPIWEGDPLKVVVTEEEVLFYEGDTIVHTYEIENGLGLTSTGLPYLYDFVGEYPYIYIYTTTSIIKLRTDTYVVVSTVDIPDNPYEFLTSLGDGTGVWNLNKATLTKWSSLGYFNEDVIQAILVKSYYGIVIMTLTTDTITIVRDNGTPEEIPLERSGAIFFGESMRKLQM